MAPPPPASTRTPPRSTTTLPDSPPPKGWRSVAQVKGPQAPRPLSRGYPLGPPTPPGATFPSTPGQTWTSAPRPPWKPALPHSHRRLPLRPRPRTLPCRGPHEAWAAPLTAALAREHHKGGRVDGDSQTTTTSTPTTGRATGCHMGCQPVVVARLLRPTGCTRGMPPLGRGTGRCLPTRPALSHP